MPKRKASSNSVSHKRARIEEVIVKSEDPDSDFDRSNDGSSTSSDSSIDSEAARKVFKKYRKKISSVHSSKKYYRMFKRDMELFQRSIDVKFSYLENLIQNVLRNQQGSTAKNFSENSFPEPNVESTKGKTSKIFNSKNLVLKTSKNVETIS